MSSISIAASGFDPVQVAMIVIFVIAGFIKWLWENWQLKNEAAKRDASVDPEEKRLRDEAWRKQTGQGQALPRSPQPQGGSSWDELRKAWKELKEAARQTQAPANPPPLRPVQPQLPPQQQARRGSVRAELATPPPKLPEMPSPQVEAVSGTGSSPIQGAQPVSGTPLLAALHNLRRDPALLRQAVLMHEILGPPKALQTSSETAI